MKANRTTRDFENALWEILATTPFAEVTVDQICCVALMHRSSFYRYFDDKVDLLKQTLSTMLRRNISESHNPDLVDQIVSFIIDNRAVFRNISIIGGNNSINLDLLTLIGKIILERPDSG
ncbi:MAG: TetR/AcrR family transcriptional regulator, partial [Paucilactobacillus nenjiangensis]